jgi:hypothetical protein
MSLPLQVIEGIFSANKGVLKISCVDAPDVRLDCLLSEYAGVQVEINLHHFPSPVDVTSPGGGSCLWHGFCPHGHREFPGWLFQQTLSGVLVVTGPQEWSVGGTLMDLSKMPGHQGRLVLLDLDGLQEAQADDTGPPDVLVQEAERLAEVLRGLQQAVKP